MHKFIMMMQSSLIWQMNYNCKVSNWNIKNFLQHKFNHKPFLINICRTLWWLPRTSLMMLVWDASSSRKVIYMISWFMKKLWWKKMKFWFKRRTILKIMHSCKFWIMFFELIIFGSKQFRYWLLTIHPNLVIKNSFICFANVPLSSY